MSIHELTQLVKLLRANGVSRYSTPELTLELAASAAQPPVVAEQLAQTTTTPKPKRPAKAVPISTAVPVDVAIPHQLNEVRNLLKLSDNDLVDRLFPEAPNLT